MSNSISMQRQSIEHCLALLESSPAKPSPEVIANARRGCLTLAWFERRTEITRALAELERAAPGLAAMFQDYPGTKVTISRRDYLASDDAEEQQEA